MASSLGTLTLDLIARIGGFTGPLDKAGANAEKNMKRITDAATTVGTVIGTTIGALAVAAPLALAALTKKQLDLIGDQDDLAKRLRTTVASLGTLTRAGELSGIGLDQLTSGAQKLDLALGKAAQGSKTQVETFERLGLSYKDVAALPVDERIVAINEALAKNVPAYERAAVAASLFGGKNAAAFQQLDAETIADARHQAELFGVALSDIDSAKVESAGDTVTIFGFALDGVQKQITVELAPVITQLSKDFLQAAEDAGGIGPAVRDSMRTAVDAVAFLVDAGDSVGRVFTVISAEFDGLVASAAGSIIAGVFQTLTLLNQLPGVDLSKQLGELEGNYNKQVDAATDATARMRAALETPLRGTAFKEYYAAAQKGAEDAAAAGGEESKQLGMTGEEFAAMTKKREADAKAAAAAAKALQSAYTSTEEGLQRQLAAIDETTGARAKATEVTKIAFELETEKLKDLSAAQKEHLLDLAKEIDAKKALQKVNDENNKLALYAQNLRSSNQTVKDGFDLALAGAGSGDKLKERLKENLSIEQDYQKQREELLKEYNAAVLQKDPEAENRYNKETELLSEALAERIVLQQDYYNQQDALQKDWLSGVSSAWENYKDTATDYQQQAADATSSILGDATNNLSTSIQGLATGALTVGEAFQSLGATLAGSVLKAIADIAAQWLITQAIQLTGIGAITTATVAAEGIKTTAKVTSDGIATASSLTATTVTTGAQVAAAGTTLAAWLPAALVASIGSFGAAAVVGGAALIAAFALIKGFEDGGYTGDGASNAPAGIVHKGEYVFTKAQTAAIGIEKLSAIANGYEDGGLVGAFPVAMPVPVREGVTTTTANDKMNSAMASRTTGNGGVTLIVNEDASKAGQTNTFERDGQQFLELWVANYLGEGETWDAQQRKTGIRAVGQ